MTIPVEQMSPAQRAKNDAITAWFHTSPYANYRFTQHSYMREGQRHITLPQAAYVIAMSGSSRDTSPTEGKGVGVVVDGNHPITNVPVRVVHDPSTRMLITAYPRDDVKPGEAAEKRRQQEAAARQSAATSARNRKEQLAKKRAKSAAASNKNK